jgi:hypothetical protein
MSTSVTRGELLLEIDTQTGATRRTVATRASETYCPIHYNRFAKAVLLARGSTRMDLVSVESGRIVASLDVDAVPGLAVSEWSFVTGYDSAGSKAYLDCTDATYTNSWITEWDWRSGATRRIGVTPAGTAPGRPAPRHHAVIPGEPVRFLRFTDFGEAYHTKHYRLAILNAEGAVVLEKDMGEAVDSMAVPAFSPDGERIYLFSHVGYGLQVLDSHALGHFADIATGLNNRDTYTPVTLDGSFVLVAGYEGIAACQTGANPSRYALKSPQEAYAAHSIHVSDDGCTVCAVFQSSKGSGGSAGYVSQLGVWKLPKALGNESKTVPLAPGKPKR